MKKPTEFNEEAKNEGGRFNQDGDLVHPDWSYTIDSDYQPKTISYSMYGDTLVQTDYAQYENKID